MGLIVIEIKQSIKQVLLLLDRNTKPNFQLGSTVYLPCFNVKTKAYRLGNCCTCIINLVQICGIYFTKLNPYKPKYSNLWSYHMYSPLNLGMNGLNAEGISW